MVHLTQKNYEIYLLNTEKYEIYLVPLNFSHKYKCLSDPLKLSMSIRGIDIIYFHA